MTRDFPAPPGDPFALLFDVDDGTVHEVRRSRGVGDRGLPSLTVELSDGSKILVSQVPLADPPFAASGRIRIEAGSRKIGEGELAAAPFRLHVHKPGLGRAPAPGKTRTMPGSMKKSG